MHQLRVTPLLLQKSSDSKRVLKRESHSFDNLNSSNSEIYAGVNKAKACKRRSNPNILDLLPPPPIYAPPSLPKNMIYYAPTNRSGKRYFQPTNQSTNETKSDLTFNKNHIKIYKSYNNDRTLENIPFDNQKIMPNHPNKRNENQTR